MAIPPSLGIGVVCTSRERTGVIAWMYRARCRAIGVVMNVTAAAMRSTSV